MSSWDMVSQATCSSCRWVSSVSMKFAMFISFLRLMCSIGEKREIWLTMARYWHAPLRTGLEKFSQRTDGHYSAAKLGLRTAEGIDKLRFHHLIYVTSRVHGASDEYHLRSTSICYSTHTIISMAWCTRFSAKNWISWRSPRLRLPLMRSSCIPIQNPDPSRKTTLSHAMFQCTRNL